MFFHLTSFRMALGCHWIFWGAPQGPDGLRGSWERLLETWERQVWQERMQVWLMYKSVLFWITSMSQRVFCPMQCLQIVEDLQVIFPIHLGFQTLFLVSLEIWLVSNTLKGTMLQLGAEGWFEDFCCGHNNFHVYHLPTKILSLAKANFIHFSFLFRSINQCLHFGYWIVWLTLAQNSGWNAQQGIVKISVAGILWSFKSLPKEAWWLLVWFSPCQRINECSTLPKVGKMSDTLRCDSFDCLKQLTAVV